MVKHSAMTGTSIITKELLLDKCQRYVKGTPKAMPESAKVRFKLEVTQKNETAL